MFDDRESYVDDKNLGSFAEKTASSFEAAGTVSSSKLAAETALCLREIKEAARISAKAADMRLGASKAAEWLLDNWYIAEREGKEAIKCLNAGIKLNAAADCGVSMLDNFAYNLVRSGLGSVDEHRLKIFSEAFQKKYQFCQLEISLLMPTVKAELIRYLRDICRGGNLNADDSGSFEKDAMERVFTSLRFFGSFDSAELLEGINTLEIELSKDPSGVYPLMDEETRHNYRHELARIAKKRRVSELEAGKKVIELAKKENCHIGAFIFTKPLGKERKERNGIGYITAVVLASAFFALLLGFVLENAVVAVLLLFPISEIIKNIIDYTVIKTTPPKRVPRLELKDGIPDEGRTLCVISALLSSPESAVKYAGLMEEYRLANRDAGSNISFGILGDLPEADRESLPKDPEVINRAAEEVEKLNAKYGGGFYFFCRSRKNNKSSGKYMGWERKRGAILELIRMICGESTSLKCYSNGGEAVESFKYVITLDGDTRLCAGSAKELVGAMLHPQNRPVIDGTRKVVKTGCGIIQPRVSVDLKAANCSYFTKIFAGQGGVDPYSSAASDVYQDLFGKGSFTGKGIIDVGAYYACLNRRIPENKVLSHDLLEGIYLNCKFMGDTEFTDGYPCKVTSYFDRMHRWTRGDWQIAQWLGGKVKNEDGKEETNPIDDIGRWKIFDNMRRSLVPVFTFAALLFGMLFSRVDFAYAAALAVLSVVSNLLISSADLMFRRESGVKVRFHSTIISGFAGWFMQTFIRLMLLPYEAWICFSGAVTAIYRMAVSKRNMLAWVTAADAELKNKNSIWVNYNKMWPCALGGMLIILLTPYASAIAVGIVWVLTPAAAMSLGKKIRETKTLSQGDRRFLLKAAGDIWKYYDENMVAQDNYLPPDNIQIRPDTGTAHRTSPTNIGLAVLAAVAAYDMGITTKMKAVGAVENILASVSRLPKWNGHLFNWYNTETMQALSPEYVSTVDSGNFIGCLIVAKEALYELGEDKIASQCEAIIDSTDFSQLYDPKRKLFYIGFDASKGEYTKGWYDLLESEARQTSYIAVAKGDVPRKHWRKLGRSLVSRDGYRGMASWTGTMFEYLMPSLILPCYKNSLLYESSKFCVYVQKRAAFEGVWGMSESAFFAFDPAMNYRYKAHGVQRLALKRNMGLDQVIAPYASFLALMVDCKSGIRNLKKLQKMGVEGKYGFYEAADLTPDRQTDGKAQIVETYMSHHLGMSIIAADNVINDGIMQRRFMRDREMLAFGELLQEKVPVGQIVLRPLERDVPEKPERGDAGKWEQRNGMPSFIQPRCSIISNGKVSMFLSELGQCDITWRGRKLVRFDGRRMCENNGISFYYEEKGKIVPLQAAPGYERDVRYSSYFSGGRAEFTAESGDISFKTVFLMPTDEPGVQIKLSLTERGGIPRKGKIICCFEPVMQKDADFASHPAFSKLSLMAEVLPHSILLKRRARGTDGGMSMCFAGEVPMGFETSKYNVFGRGTEVHSEGITTAPGIYGPRAEPDMYVCGAADVLLKSRECRELKFALAPGDNPEEAIEITNSILKNTEVREGGRTDGIGKSLGMSTLDIDKAMTGLSEMVFAPNRDGKTEKFENARSTLWSIGISGDLPITAVAVYSGEDIEKAEKAIKEHALLRASGFAYDLVLLLADGNDYRSPIKTTLRDNMRVLGCDGSIGARGGVHFVEKDSAGAAAVLSVADRFADGKSRSGDIPAQAWPEVEKRDKTGNGESEKWRYNDDGSVTLAVCGNLPYPAWGSILASNRFGYIATDAGTGHMWHLNSRENKINRWLNDFRTETGTETLKLISGGEKISLFAAEDGYSCRVTFGFGYAVWEKTIGEKRTRVTAFVPPESAARVLIIETDNANAGDTVGYYSDLVLGTGESKKATVDTSFEDEVFSAVNLNNSEFQDDVFRLTSSAVTKRFTCDRLSYLLGELEGKTGYGLDACFAAEYNAEEKTVIVSGMESTEMLKKLADYRMAAAALHDTKEYWEKKVKGITVSTVFPMFDSYINGWALYQVLACRIFARASLYQCGGAYGFRDQLQDACAIIVSDPMLAKKQIILAAGHQYAQGDVQHWWHPVKDKRLGEDKGVRTKCSDDMLWLPYTLCEYVEKTGDKEICGETVKFISSPVLNENEKERYEQPQNTVDPADMFEHCERAIRIVLERGTGEHGLCYFGTGDWNDGMNMVGEQGTGESVWLTWFASLTMKKFAGLCNMLGLTEKANEYENRAEKLAGAADGAWDGKWYLRGYYDDGTPLGSSESEECRIDSIAQSFSVLSGESSEKTDTALESAFAKLYDEKLGIVKLFDPPFDSGDRNPGYIKGYSPGFRENGGQYTHGAVWLAAAMLRAGKRDKGWSLMKAILPLTHDPEAYKAEPYVLAGDVYANPDHAGRGGWSWYTGAAGWYYRIATETLLGIVFRGGRMFVEPHLPEEIKEFSGVINTEAGEYRVKVINGEKMDVIVNESPYSPNGYPAIVHKILIPN